MKYNTRNSYVQQMVGAAAAKLREPRHRCGHERRTTNYYCSSMLCIWTAAERGHIRQLVNAARSSQ